MIEYQHTNDCMVHEPTLRPCSCGLETRLRSRLAALEAARDRLEKSLQEGVLLGNFNEPLDAYGKRLLRVILVEFDRALSALPDAGKEKKE